MKSYSDSRTYKMCPGLEGSYGKEFGTSVYDPSSTNGQQIPQVKSH